MMTKKDKKKRTKIKCLHLIINIIINGKYSRKKELITKRTSFYFKKLNKILNLFFTSSVKINKMSRTLVCYVIYILYITFLFILLYFDN